jgi:hypothetical protein
MPKNNSIKIEELGILEISSITGGRCCVCYCSNSKDIRIGYNTVDAGDCGYAWNHDKECSNRCYHYGYRYYAWVTQNECGL